MKGSGNYDGHADAHQAHQNRHRDVLLLDDFAPQPERRNTVEDGKGGQEKEQSDGGIRERVQEIARVEFGHRAGPSAPV